jgi:hypothetical protein
MASKPNAFNTGKGTNPRLTVAPTQLIPQQAWSDNRPRNSTLKTDALAAVKAKLVVFKK